MSFKRNSNPGLHLMSLEGQYLIIIFVENNFQTK